MVYNFVIKYSDAKIENLLKIESLTELAINHPKKAAKIFAKGDLSWCFQTFVNLSRTTNLKVQCSNKLAEGCINIIHSDSLLKLKGKKSHFIVCVQADHARRHWSHYHIVQNKNQVFAHTSFIPHWVLPGLLKRDSNRQGVKRVAYAGQTYNNNLAGLEDTWKTLLEPYKIEFVTLSNGSWHDMRDIDVLIGIRSFDNNPHKTKPPSKLFNAWHAGIPFIGGSDSAYQQVGTPGEDYIMVKTQQEAIQAIIQLQNDPVFYQRLVQNGYKKVAVYNQETITHIWLDVLTNPVMRRYQQWKTKPFVEQTRFNALLGMGSLQHSVKKLVKRLIGKNKTFLPGFLLFS